MAYPSSKIICMKRYMVFSHTVSRAERRNCSLLCLSVRFVGCGQLQLFFQFLKAKCTRTTLVFFSHPHRLTRLRSQSLQIGLDTFVCAPPTHPHPPPISLFKSHLTLHCCSRRTGGYVSTCVCLFTGGKV